MNPKLDNIIMDPSNDKFKDECGVFGVYSNREIDVASITYYGLYALQHRGQESAGIAVANGEDINIKKGMGLITEAFSQEDINSLKGFTAIGHVRYSTSGDTRIVEYLTCPIAVKPFKELDMLDIQQVEILELKMHSHY